MPWGDFKPELAIKEKVLNNNLDQIIIRGNY